MANTQGSQENVKHYTVLKQEQNVSGLSFLKNNLAIKIKVSIKFTPFHYRTLPYVNNWDMLGEKLHDKSIYVRSEAFKLVYGKKLGGS